MIRTIRRLLRLRRCSICGVSERREILAYSLLGGHSMVCVAIPRCIDRHNRKRCEQVRRHYERNVF